MLCVVLCGVWCVVLYVVLCLCCVWFMFVLCLLCDWIEFVLCCVVLVFVFMLRRWYVSGSVCFVFVSVLC